MSKNNNSGKRNADSRTVPADTRPPSARPAHGTTPPKAAARLPTPWRQVPPYGTRTTAPRTGARANRRCRGI